MIFVISGRIRIVRHLQLTRYELCQLIGLQVLYVISLLCISYLHAQFFIFMFCIVMHFVYFEYEIQIIIIIIIVSVSVN